MDDLLSFIGPAAVICALFVLACWRDNENARIARSIEFHQWQAQQEFNLMSEPEIQDCALSEVAGAVFPHSEAS